MADAKALPEGFLYVPGFLDASEERVLMDEIARLEFSEVRMRGVVAKRRVIHLGWLYGYDSWSVKPGPPIPDFLLPARANAAGLVRVAPEELGEALITEYRPGATIGWHRDAPPFGIVIGISLAAPCRFRFRRGEMRNWETAELELQPRSAYVLAGEARTKWQHSIPAVKALRYSITFRTLRRKKG